MNGPRLKSSKRRFLTSARYRNGFPSISCNIKRLPHSTDSIRSGGFPSIPAGFCHKIHHSSRTYA